MEAIETRLAKLEAEVCRLRSENAIRQVLNRYMFLCDVPLPEFDMSEEDRATAISELFTPDAIWEGVGGAHGQQFGQHRGQAEIRAHFLRFYTAQEPRQIFNTHYVCSEQITLGSEGAEGRWVQFQPWIFEDGRSLLRSSRLQVFFRETDLGWKISRYRTENLFIADLPNNWTSTHIEKSFLTAPLG
jgi:hypothetical protein